MSQKPDVILGANGRPVWQCDPGTGNTSQAGTMAALDLVLPPEASPNVPAPGYLKLYSPDGQSIALLNSAGTTDTVTPGSAYATVAGAGQTVTGVTAETVLAGGITVPAGGLAAGQVYHFVATGTITTTVDTQTIDMRLRFGGLAGTLVYDFGVQNPDGSGVITGASWRAEFNIIVTSATNLVISGQNALNFFYTSTANTSTAVTNAVAKQLTLTVQPSATAVSMTCAGFSCERVA